MAQTIKHFQKPWQVMVAVCLNRMNLVSRNLYDIEERYAKFQEELEFRQSVYNDYESKKINLQKIEKSNLLKDNTSDASRQLASIQDEMDMWLADSKKLTPSSKENSDVDKDKTSLQRHMKEILHFVVNDSSLLNEETMLYPYDKLLPNETLRTASERILKSHGITHNALFLSNAPVGCLKVRFRGDEERGKEYQGAKVFITKAQLKAPQTSPFFHNNTERTSTNNSTTQWLTGNELQQTLHNEYYKKISKFI